MRCVKWFVNNIVELSVAYDAKVTPSTGTTGEVLHLPAFFVLRSTLAALIVEVKKQRGKSKPLTAAALKALRKEDAHTLAPARVLATEALTLERQLSDLVNAACGLTPAEVQLMWDTAPPRMPIAPPM